MGKTLKTIWRACQLAPRQDRIAEGVAYMFQSCNQRFNH